MPLHLILQGTTKVTAHFVQALERRTMNPWVVVDKFLRGKRKRRRWGRHFGRYVAHFGHSFRPMLADAIAEIEICGSPTRARTWDLRINSATRPTGLAPRQAPDSADATGSIPLRFRAVASSGDPTRQCE